MVAKERLEHRVNQDLLESKDLKDLLVTKEL